MNAQEWIEFKADFSNRFPTDWEWLQSHPDTLSLWWRDVFSGLGLDDCLAVSREIFTGRLAAWEAYERDRIPATYQREVGLIRQERRARAEVIGYREHDRRARGGGIEGALAHADKSFDDGKSMAACFRHCEKMKAEGASPEERQAYVDQYFG